MADTKPVEVPKEETAPVVAEPAAAVETPVAAATETPAAPAEPEVAATTETPAETPAAPAEEAKEEEKKPVEEGHLSHKGEGAGFPKYVIAGS